MTTTSNIQVAKKQTIATASNDDKKLEKVHFSTLIKSESVQKALYELEGTELFGEKI